MKNSKMTAEDNTMEEILEEALAIENVDKTAKIFRRQKATHVGGGKTMGLGNRATTSTAIRPSNAIGHQFARHGMPSARQEVTTAAEVKSTSATAGSSVSTRILPGTSGASKLDEKSASATVRDRKAVDLSKVQCFKCKEYGHFASAHDKLGFRAMHAEELDSEDVIVEGENNAPEVGSDPGSQISGDQYEGSEDSLEELDEYTLAEEFDEDKMDYLTFAPMRLVP